MVSLDVKCCLRNPIISKAIEVDESSSASDLRALVSVCFEIEPYSFGWYLVKLHSLNV